MHKIKKYLNFLMVMVMTFQVIATLDIKSVRADTSSTKISKLRILELTDSTKLKSSNPTPITKYKPSVSDYMDIEITTMSMKTFAAMREEIDGRYDVIYISSAYYSTVTKDQNVELSNFNGSLNDGAINGNDATNVMNDITALKVKEIGEFLQDNNNYLVVHQNIKDGINIDKDSLVYTTYNKITAPTKETGSNLLFINSEGLEGANAEEKEAINFYKELLKTSITNNISIHPNLVNVQGLNTSILNGETKKVTYNISNAVYLEKKVKDIKIFLYADGNANGFFEKSEIVVQNSIQSSDLKDTTYDIEYVPDGTYKNIPLKLEAVAEVLAQNDDNKTKFYVTGLYTFKGDTLNLNVLQILGQGATYLPAFEDTTGYNNYKVNVVGKYLQQNGPTSGRKDLLFEYNVGEIKTDNMDPFEQKVFSKIVETKKLTNPNYTLASYNLESSSEKLKLYNDTKLAFYVEEYDVLLLGLSEQRHLMNIASSLTTEQTDVYAPYLEKLLT